MPTLLIGLLVFVLLLWAIEYAAFFVATAGPGLGLNSLAGAEAAAEHGCRQRPHRREIVLHLSA